MKPAYTNDEYVSAKLNDYLNLICYSCGKIFKTQKKRIKYILKTNNDTHGKFCSRKCYSIYNNKVKLIYCANCNKEIYIRYSQINESKSGNHFCSLSCTAIYNNTHKTNGIRKSKLEKYLEIKLVKLYPNIKILFNNKTIINSELDIYIPKIKLAFELNGIFHYEPIYGHDKLSQIQNNDNRKFQACVEQNIELCIIDVSQQKYFKEQSSEKYLNIIINIINKKLLFI